MGYEVFSPEYFMNEALKQARIAYDNGEIPIGAVVVCKDRIIAKAHNQVEMLNDATAHAEILAITAASDYLGNKYLNECSLYVTLEPCVMCAGACFWAQLEQLIYGASDPKRGYTTRGSDILHPKTIIKQGLLSSECEKLLTDFFSNLRE